MKKINKENKELKKIKPIIVRILKKNGVMKAGIFGSYARGEQKKKSDVDILIDPPKNIGLFEFIGIKLELEDELRRKIDLVDYRVIKPLIKEKVLNEEVRIL